MMRRERWLAFRDEVERTASLGDDELHALLLRVTAQDDPWLVRACIVTLVRGDRELLTDAQLAEVARRFGGKIATFIATVLERRRQRRAT
jgi:hypothetical protein